MSQNIYRVKGMHCASCAHIIEKTLKKAEGVHLAEVNYGTEKAKITFDETKTNPHHLSKKIEPLGYSLVVPSVPSTGSGPSAESMGMSESEHAEHLGLNQSKQEKLAEIKDMKSKVMSAIPLAIISAFVLGWEILGEYKAVPKMSVHIEEFSHHLLPLLAT